MYAGIAASNNMLTKWCHLHSNRCFISFLYNGFYAYREVHVTPTTIADSSHDTTVESKGVQIKTKGE